MNIKITKEQSEYLFKNHYGQFVIGSHLYGTNSKDSDTDILVMYHSKFESDKYYPNYHQFQYDAESENTQYVFTSDHQFWKNLLSGDSTINADVIMFYDLLYDKYEDKLNICKTYNTIKSFIGFAKRDIKNYKQGKGKNKLFHIQRGLYCAECLLHNKLPQLSDIKEFGIKTLNIEELEKIEKDTRNECNKLFENNELTMYPKESLIKPTNEIEKLLIESNNIREFKYD